MKSFSNLRLLFASLALAVFLVCFSGTGLIASDLNSVNSRYVEMGPAIDGCFSENEWGEPQVTDVLEFVDPESDESESHQMYAYFKNDMNYLYIAVRVLDEDFDQNNSPDILEIWFDNDNDGIIEPCEDIKGFEDLQYDDMYFEGGDPEDYGWDSDEILNGSGEASFSNGEYIYELRVPFDSGDIQDATIPTEGTLGILIRYAETYSDEDGYSWFCDNEDSWPLESIDGPVDGSAYARLSISQTGGTGSGAGDGSGSGSGTGDGSGNGSGNGTGDGSGSGSGNGTGDGSGNGSGNGTGDGSGNGSGNGTGDGSGSGSGNGTGDGSGSGTGSGAGDGSGSGSGNGTGDGNKQQNYVDWKANPVFCDEDHPWTIVFSHAVDEGSVTEENIFVSDSDNNVVSFISLSIGDDGKSVIVTPLEPYYTIGETYKLKIRNCVISKDARKNLKNALRMRFKIK